MGRTAGFMECILKAREKWMSRISKSCVTKSVIWVDHSDHLQLKGRIELISDPENMESCELHRIQNSVFTLCFPLANWLVFLLLQFAFWFNEGFVDTNNHHSLYVLMPLMPLTQNAKYQPWWKLCLDINIHFQVFNRSNLSGVRLIGCRIGNVTEKLWFSWA